jgi:hypothetical protein
VGTGSVEVLGSYEGRTLPLNEMKQQFSLAYVHMIASAAGCSIKLHRTDYDGVDVSIVSSAEYETHYGPEIELQVKCTARTELLTSATMQWRMDAKPFRLLTHPKAYLPRFLGILLVPRDPALWLDQDESRLLTSSCMYWERASKLGSIAEHQETRLVHLPRCNILNVEQLQGIMKMIGEGGEL